MLQRDRIWNRPRARVVALTASMWALLIGLVLVGRTVLLPLMLATMAAYVIEPAIAAIARRRIRGRTLPRWTAVLLVYAVLAAAAWLVALAVIPQMYREGVRGLGELRDFLSGLTPERFERWAQGIDAFLQRYGIPVDVVPGDGSRAGRFSVDLAAVVADSLQKLSADLRGRLGDVVGLSRAILAGTLSTMFSVLLLFMVTAFLSVDAPRIVAFSASLVPSAHRDDLRRLLQGIDAGLAGVVRGQLTIMLVNGTLTLVGLLLLKIPFAFALAVVATLLYVVPIFGTILSSIPIVLLALAAGGLPKGLLALAWIAGIHALEAYFLNPKIMGDAARIHPVLIVLALVVGERSAGILGALLAVPMMSVFVAVFRFTHQKMLEADERSTAADGAPVVEGERRLPP